MRSCTVMRIKVSLSWKLDSMSNDTSNAFCNAVANEPSINLPIGSIHEH